MSTLVFWMSVLTVKSFYRVCEVSVYMSAFKCLFILFYLASAIRTNLPGNREKLVCACKMSQQVF